ncbi:tRNA-splicing endonuclease subunit Sen15 [Sphaerosporella brunnea]|uniref:tRNA-splicing endonuclease subunit Sen15 n=1 Tax=Sphaerosporella brunnea TaxID=1250544 RepID=A0A5J5F1C6_9PEZI|nr:tRNA-splicing endonuclease subunit Sen15 [Sphaerosporella brunnea]
MTSYTPAEHQAHAHLLQTVHANLEHTALWTSLTAHTTSTYPRPLLSGVPPAPIYVDPDADPNVPLPAASTQREWVLPVDLREKWSPKKMAQVFDSLPAGDWGVDAKGGLRKKRLLLAVVAEDSTVVYYFVHDGVVKPRQN